MDKKNMKVDLKKISKKYFFKIIFIRYGDGNFFDNEGNQITEKGIKKQKSYN